MRLGTASAFLVGFYSLVLLVYTRPFDRRAAAAAVPPSLEATPPPPAAAADGALRAATRRPLRANLSAVAKEWVASRIAEKKPVRLVVAGMSASGTDWLAAVLRIIMEEALQAQGHAANQIQVVPDACKGRKYCIATTTTFAPPALADADAVFTAHRDMRDVLLYHAASPGGGKGSARSRLDREYGVYVMWRAHACRDVRFEDVLSYGAAREARELLGALGLRRRVDLLAVVRKMGTWARTTQQQQQQVQQKAAASIGRPALLALLTESVGVHKLVFNGPLQSGSSAAADAHLRSDVGNVTAAYARWLVQHGFEEALPPLLAAASGDAAADAPGGAGSTRAAPAMRCPLGAPLPKPAASAAAAALSRPGAPVAAVPPVPAVTAEGETNAAWCGRKAREHGVVPHRTWGGLSTDDQQTWTSRGCDAITTAAKPPPPPPSAAIAVTVSSPMPKTPPAAALQSPPPPPPPPWQSSPPPSPSPEVMEMVVPSACYEFSPLSSSTYFVRFGCFLKLSDERGVLLRRIDATAKLGARTFQYLSWGRKKFYGERAWYGLASAALGSKYVPDFSGCVSAKEPAIALVSTCCATPAWCPTSQDGERWDDPPPEVSA